MREGPERVPAQNFLVLLTLGMKLLLVLGITAILDLGAKETPLGLVTQMVVGAAVTAALVALFLTCLLYTSPSPRDRQKSRMPSSA